MTGSREGGFRFCVVLLLSFLCQINSVDPATMGKILGHKDIETTMIYTHQTQEHLRKIIGKIDIK